VGEYGCGLLDVLIGHDGENKGVGEALNERRWKGAGRCVWSLQCDDLTELGKVCVLFDMVFIVERKKQAGRSVQGTGGTEGRREGDNVIADWGTRQGEQGVYLSRSRNGLGRGLGTGLGTRGKWANDIMGNGYWIMTGWS